MLIALVLVSGVLIVALAGDGDDTAASSSTPAPSEPVDAVEGGTVVAGGDAEVVAECPADGNRPEVRRVWQDGAGIHVVIAISTTCAVDQLVSDGDARFGIFAGAEAIAEASFDFSTGSPVVLPASGSTAAIELVFDGEADLNLAALEQFALPSSEATAQAGGFDLRYIFRCTPTGDTAATPAAALVTAETGADLGDRSAPGEVGSPEATTTTVPAVPTELVGDAALRELERIAAEDRPHVDSTLFDRWVPQLSAKNLGTTDPTTGIHYTDHGQILDNYLDLLARYPDLNLVNSSTYSSFKLDDYWVMVLGTSFVTAEDVNAWCDGEGWGRDDCYAKRINQGDYEGNTRVRP